MTDSPKKPYDLNTDVARLLMREPFFAALSRKIDKTSTTAIPTAGVRINKERAQFELLYNPEFMGSLSETHKLGVLKHEFYHIIFEHVTGRAPAGGMKKIDNIAMDLAINGLPDMRTILPREGDEGPLVDGQPMLACIPSMKPFEDLPCEKSYEWYLKAIQDRQPENEEGEGAQGGQGGMPRDFDDHSAFGEGEGSEASHAIAKERLKKAIKEAAEEAIKANSWGTVSSSVRNDIIERISPRVDWKKVLRYFVKTTQRSDKTSTPRKLNKRFPRIHSGKRVRRHARIAVSIDQSGSVDDTMLAAFFSELNKLAKIAEFTVVPFDTKVAEDKVYVWKKGKSHRTERVLTGGTCFDAPTRYVNEHNFDGHIILTDLMAPKPVRSNCQRMWMTTKHYASTPYFETNERVIAIDCD